MYRLKKTLKYGWFSKFNLSLKIRRPLMKQCFTKTLITLIVTSSLNLTLAAYDNTDRNTQVQIITALKNNEVSLNTLNERVKYIQDSYSGISQEINSLKQSLAVEKQNNAQLEREIAALKQQISSDRAQMQKSLDGAVDKIAQETSKAVNAAVKTSKSAPPVQEKFLKYKVQDGATLNTIAKAYKVSVDSIKKANNLKDNNLSTGQTLLIPKIN